MGEHDTSNAVFPNHPGSIQKNIGYCTLEERLVFGASIDVLRLIVDCLKVLRRQWILRVEGITENRVWEYPAIPNEEEIRKFGVRNGIVIWWIGEPDVGRFARKR